jgi:hypothetical protein
MAQQNVKLSVHFPWWVMVSLGIVALSVRVAIGLRLWRPTEAQSELLMNRVGAWAADHMVARVR